MMKRKHLKLHQSAWRTYQRDIHRVWDEFLASDETMLKGDKYRFHKHGSLVRAMYRVMMPKLFKRVTVQPLQLSH